MRKNKVFWTEAAQKDLEEIIEYIALDSVESAVQHYEKIKKTAETLTSFPYQGRVIPELYRQNITKYREIIIAPWRLMYKKEKETIYIMAFIDGRRNIEDALLKRQLR
ncbi:MAG TPA: type II toxin-antitoxin system RelE/ParE family toxin [Sediminispirochaeta sp.]|nr:type II toxin-antitoxin system RelE/ParE family toxin [Sediminispirochaeta sp.]